MTHEQKVYKHFTRDIATHEMTIALDQDLYRHLQFRNPDSGIGWFDVITWPGKLTINGDMGTFTFGRIADMFEFFGGREPGYVNEHYWAEKLVAISRYNSEKEFDEDLFKAQVVEHFWESREYYDASDARQIWEAIKDQIFDDYADRHDSDACQYLLRDFVSPVSGFDFGDHFEWDFTDWGHQFVWCLHAITHAIRTYRQGKAS